MNLLLLGLRGSGKSTIGPLLAAQLNRPFTDLDQLTIRHLGCATVKEAWQKRGEQAFRAAEVEALAEVLKAQGQIIALGGGTPTAPRAADLLRAAQSTGAAQLVYLAAGTPTLRQRIAGAGLADRPSLTGADPLAEMEGVLARRDPLYRDLADHVVDAEQSAGAVVDEILRSIDEL